MPTKLSGKDNRIGNGWNATSYIRSFDVAIIPHHVGELENDGDPIKLYEYMAAGRPIVTTPIGGVEKYRPLITIAETAEDFAHGIRCYLNLSASERDALSKRLQEAVSPEMTWAGIADGMMGHILSNEVGER